MTRTELVWEELDKKLTALVGEDSTIVFSGYVTASVKDGPNNVRRYVRYLLSNDCAMDLIYSFGKPYDRIGIDFALSAFTDWTGWRWYGPRQAKTLFKDIHTLEELNAFVSAEVGIYVALQER